MNIIDKNIDEVIPYANNPRHNDEAVDAVAASIKEFGFKVPVIIDKDNVIVAGHTRVKAAKKLKMKTVPCIVADDLTESQVSAFRIADNKVSELAEWDFSKLEEELLALDDIDMEQFGFDLTDYSKSEKEEPEEDPFDDIEKLDKHYGVPYRGNKSRIADIIISILPSGGRLVDLFGGVVL